MKAACPLEGHVRSVAFPQVTSAGSGCTSHTYETSAISSTIAPSFTEALNLRLKTEMTKHGLCEQAVYAWRKNYGALEAADVKQLRSLQGFPELRHAARTPADPSPRARPPCLQVLCEANASPGALRGPAQLALAAGAAVIVPVGEYAAVGSA